MEMLSKARKVLGKQLARVVRQFHLVEEVEGLFVIRLHHVLYLNKNLVQTGIKSLFSRVEALEVELRLPLRVLGVLLDQEVYFLELFFRLVEELLRIEFLKLLLDNVLRLWIRGTLQHLPVRVDHEFPFSPRFCDDPDAVSLSLPEFSLEAVRRTPLVADPVLQPSVPVSKVEIGSV